MSGFYVRVRTSYVRMSLEWLVVLVVYVAVVFRLFPTFWQEAYDTLWIHVHALAMVAMEVGIVRHMMYAKDRSTHLEPHQLVGYQVLSVASLLTSLVLLARTVYKVAEGNQEDEEWGRLSLIVASTALSCWRMAEVFQAEATNIPTHHSPHTGTPIHVDDTRLSARHIKTSHLETTTG